QDDGRRRAHADPGSRHARVQRNRSFHLPEDAEADVALRRAAIAALGAHAAIGPIAGVAAAAHGHAATADDPLPGVAGHVDQTPGIARTPAGGNQRAAAVAAASRRRHAVAVLGLLEAAAGAGGIEPFGIRRQAIAEAADIAEPPRISLRLAERDVGDRRIAEIRIADRLGCALAGCAAERVELVDRYLRTRHRIRPSTARARHHHHEGAIRRPEAVAAELAGPGHPGFGA